MAFGEYPEFHGVDAGVGCEGGEVFVVGYESLGLGFLFYEVAEDACAVLFVVGLACLLFLVGDGGGEGCGDELAVGV